jgi:hypothetical protein
MSFSLPDNIVLPASPERHNIAIAEIAFFAAVLPVELGVRYLQIRRRAKSRGARNPLRCFLRAWLNFVVIFALSTYQESLYSILKNRTDFSGMMKFGSLASHFISA